MAYLDKEGLAHFWANLKEKMDADNINFKQGRLYQYDEDDEDYNVSLFEFLRSLNTVFTNAVNGKQDKLTAGDNVNISTTNVISVPLTNYYTKNEVDTKLEDYYTAEEIDTLLNQLPSGDSSYQNGEGMRW